MGEGLKTWVSGCAAYSTGYRCPLGDVPASSQPHSPGDERSIGVRGCPIGSTCWVTPQATTPPALTRRRSRNSLSSLAATLPSWSHGMRAYMST